MAQLLGPDGRPIQTRTLTEEVATATVQGVRPIVADHPAKGLTPSGLAQILEESETGDPRRWFALSEDIEERDPHYRAVLATRTAAVTGEEIRVEPASEDAADEAAADLVRDWLDRDTLREELDSLLDAIAKGFAIAEIRWDTSGGRWWPVDIWAKPQRWFVVDPTDGWSLRLRTDDPDGAELPPWKFVIHRAGRRTGSAIRAGTSRTAAWYYLFKTFSLKDWLAYSESYGHPARIGRVPAGATQVEIETMARAISSIAANYSAVLPAGMDLEFLEAQRFGSQALYENLATFCDRQLSKLVLGQTTTTDAVSGGHAVSREHEKVRQDIAEADRAALAVTLNRQVVRPLIDANLGARERYPRIVIGPPDATDFDRLMVAVEKAVPLGFQVGQTQLREAIGIEAPAENDELLAPPAAPGLFSSRQVSNRQVSNRQVSNGLVSTGPHHPGETASITLHSVEDPIDNVDHLVADLLADWEDTTAPLLDPVRDLVARAGGLEEVRDGLVDLLAAPGMADRLADRLAAGLFSARASGRMGIELDGGLDDDPGEPDPGEPDPGEPGQGEGIR